MKSIVAHKMRNATWRGMDKEKRELHMTWDEYLAYLYTSGKEVRGWEH